MSKMQSLEGRNAIVTGGSRGIGAGIAEELASRGANVLITYNSASTEAEKVTKKLEAMGCQSFAVQARGTDPAAPAAVIRAAMEKWKSIDIIVNNAGAGDDCFIQDLNYEIWDKLHSTNIRFPVFLVKEAIPYFGKAPRIVNLSSAFARLGGAGCLAYVSTKGALEAATRVMAQELGHKYGATVNCVNPGPVATDMWLRDTEQEVLDEWEAKVKETPAAPRIATVDDVAQIVAFLCEEQSRWSTGSVVNANGGLCFV